MDEMKSTAGTKACPAERFTIRLVVLAWIVFAALASGCSKSGKGGTAASPRPLKENFSLVDNNDPEMVAAIAKARATLPRFWKTLEQPKDGETGFALKVEIKDAKGTEFFWANNIERKDGKVYGVINNDPEIVGSVKFGQRLEIADAQIADWLFMNNGKMVGNYTLRPLFKTMPKEDAAKLRAILEEP